MLRRAFTVSNLTYRVGEATLIDRVDLHGYPGEVIAIIGPNGAGKSTLLRLLAGDLVPDEGIVLVGDLDTSQVSPVELARERAVMRQGGSPDIPFTAAAVVEMGRYPRRNDPDGSLEADRAAITTAMERTDTAHLAARAFSTLSGGEQTRVSMARTMAQQAPLILLDEPTTALDVAHQERLLAEIRLLATEDHCVVAVFHDLNAAAFYADRVVLMANARIRVDGTPREVLRADLLRSVYGQPMLVTEHPTRECPLVMVTDDATSLRLD